MFCGLQEVNKVTLSDKTERAIIVNISFYTRIVGFWPRTRCVTKIAFQHVPFPVNFLNN